MRLSCCSACSLAGLPVKACQRRVVRGWAPQTPASFHCGRCGKAIEMGGAAEGANSDARMGVVPGTLGAAVDISGLSGSPLIAGERAPDWTG
jgi:hypothetical protein